MEIEFLKCLDYQLYISKEKYADWIKTLRFFHYRNQLKYRLENQNGEDCRDCSQRKRKGMSGNDQKSV